MDAKHVLEEQAVRRANSLMLDLATAVEGQPLGDVAGALATLLIAVTSTAIKKAGESAIITTGRDEEELRRFARRVGEQMMLVADTLKPELQPLLRDAVRIIEAKH